MYIKKGRPKFLSQFQKDAIAAGLKRAYAEGGRKQAHSMETRKKMSELKIIAYKEGRIKPVFLGQKRPDLTGEKNASWRGGVTSANDKARKVFRKTMHKAVLERDGYACVIGGKAHGTDLQVDHIQSWADFVELRFSMDNCRTLCMNCHYLITYGKPKPEGVIWGHNFSKGGALK